MLRRKSEAEKFMHHCQDFMERNTWDNVSKYISFFDAHDIPFLYIDSKEQIEKFAEDNKEDLEISGEIVSAKGDCDYIHESFYYDRETIEQNIRNAIERVGENSLKVSMSYSLIDKEGKTLKNAVNLKNLGVQVTFRKEDESVRGIVVEQRDEKGRIKRKSSLFWKSIAKKEEFGRREGYPQKPGEMNYEGYIIGWDGKNSEEPQVPFILASNDYTHKLWKRGVNIDDLIKEKARAEFLQKFRRF